MNRTNDHTLTSTPPRPGTAVRRPRVVLVLDATLPDYASLVRGCVEAAEQTGQLEIFYRGLFDRDVAGEIGAGGPRVAGVLCRTTAPHLPYLRRCGRPVVLLEQDHAAGFPSVRADNAAIGRMAAEFLLAKGHRRFGYWGVAGALYSDERERAFAEVIRRSGNELFSCHLPPHKTHRRRVQRPMEHWLPSLPRPVAVLTDTTTHAREVVALCEHLGFAVPEEVAVLSCDSDALLCTTIHPSISGIDQNMRQIGYEAAILMSRLLAGETVPCEPHCIPPVGVIERQSTDSFAVDDRSLAAALNCIRSRATAGRIAVRDIAQAAGLSLHTLQRRFRTRLGRTVQQEIARVRNETAQRLLLTTRLPMTAVAEHSGYESSPVFTRAFCRATGTTPLAFRRGGGERTSQ